MPAFLRLKTPQGELLDHIFHCLGHIQTYLSIPVEKAPVGNGFFLQAQCDFIIIHKIASLMNDV